MRLVYKFKIKQNDKIYDLCRISKIINSGWLFQPLRVNIL